MSDGRPSRDEILMRSAWLWSKRSTCARLHVGAVFSRDGRILVSGYNGAPSGIPHCNHDCTCFDQPIRTQKISKDKMQLLEVRDHHGQYHAIECPAVQPCTISEHAERNGVAYAARNGVRLEGSTLYATHQPCLPCAMSLINAGVERVVYDKPYRLSDGIELLQQARIVVDVYNVDDIG